MHMQMHAYTYSCVSFVIHLSFSCFLRFNCFMCLLNCFMGYSSRGKAGHPLQHARVQRAPVSSKTETALLLIFECLRRRLFQRAMVVDFAKDLEDQFHQCAEKFLNRLQLNRAMQSFSGRESGMELEQLRSMICSAVALGWNRTSVIVLAGTLGGNAN